MQLTDSRDIKAAPETVWAAILNPDVLKDCVPGCESMTGSVADGFEAAVVQKVGPVKARFSGVVSFTDIVPGRSLTLTGEGKGGAAGFAKGSAQVTMEPIPEGTRLTYEVQANVGGKIAQLGSRIIDGFAKKMADEFFARFQQGLEAPEPEVATDAAAEEGDEGEAGEGANGEKKGWFRRLIG